MFVSLWWRKLHSRYAFLTDSAVLFLSTVSNAVLGFLFWVVAARLYTQQVVGITSALMSAVFVIGNLGRLGLDYTLVVTLPKEPNNALRYTMSMISLAIVGCVAALIALFFATQRIFAVEATAAVSQTWWLVLAFMVCCSLWGVGLVAEQILLLNHLGHFIIYKNLAFSIAKLVALVIFLPLVGQQFGISAAVAIGIVLGMVIAWRGLTAGFEWQPGAIKKALAQLGSSFATTSLKNYLSATVAGLPNWILPLIVVDRLGSTAAAHFYTSWMIFTVVNNGPAALGNGLLVEGARRGKATPDLLRQAYTYMLIFLLPAMIFLFIGTPYIMQAFGSAYTEVGTQLLRNFTLAVIPFGIIQINFMKLRGDGRLTVLIILSALLSLGILSGSYLLLPSYGIQVIGSVLLVMCSLVSVLSCAILFKGIQEPMNSLILAIYRSKAAFGDLYLAFVSAALILVHAYLSVYTPSILESVRILPLLVGVLVMVFPGYLFCRLLGFERYGIATMAGLTLVSSFALLSFVGVLMWLTLHSFSAVFLEVFVFGWILFFSLINLIRSREAREPVQFSVRWQALALTTLPLGFVVLLLNLQLPISPAIRYTEFSVDPHVVHPDSFVNVTIVDHENQTKTYVIVASRNGAEVRSSPVLVAADKTWTGLIQLPPGSGNVNLALYMDNNPTPYRTLDCKC